MSTLRELHNQAMDLTEAAILARMHNRHAPEILTLTRKAFEYERRAADLLADPTAPEPSRSVMHRSAATLAANCGEYREAERLIGRALAGEPPEEIAEELRDLLERVYFERHLRLRGITLLATEVQVSISGREVAPGLAPSQDMLDRLQHITRLVYRTLDRKANVPFRETVPSDKYRDLLFISTPRAASFAVTLHLGYGNQLPLPGHDLTEGVLEDILDGVKLVNEGRVEDLARLIPDPAYNRNFVGLTKRIAPDGEKVSQVGFTMRGGLEERAVQLTRVQAQIHIKTSSMSTTPHGLELRRVVGELKFADARHGPRARIKLISDASRREYTVIVPSGWMADIVKPLWQDRVVVTGIPRNDDTIELQDISRAD
jgi:hypothetical protein